jgi:hypothetical protein
MLKRIWPAFVLLLLSLESHAVQKTTPDTTSRKAVVSDDQEDEEPVKPPDAGPVFTQAQIIATLRGKRDDMQHCYEAELPKNRSLAGHVVVQFTIQSSGAISDLSVKETTLGSPPVEQCILHIAGGIVFSPKPSSPITLAYGWNFGVTPSKPK